MKMRIFLPLTACAWLLLSSCGKTPPASGPHATIMLRDGTTASGNVLSSSPTEVQLAGDDKITRTIPMSQVRSIDYGEAAPATSAANPEPVAPPAANPATAAPAPSASAPKSAAAPPPSPAEAAVEDHYHAAESAVTTRTYRVPAGTEVSVRTDETIDSSKASEGQTFAADVTRDVRDESGAVVIPRGANAQLIIRSATKGGRIRGASDLVLDMASVSIDGRQYELSTTDLVQKGKQGVGGNKRTGEFVGGGAAIGAIIGAIAGHGKGAAIGAGAGAGGGALAQVLTKGTLRIPVESVLTFRLDAPLRVVARQ